MHTAPRDERAIAIVDDWDLVVDGVRAALDASDGSWHIAAVRVDELLAGGCAADVVLWDPGLEHRRLEQTERLVRAAAPAPVLAFSWCHDLPLVMETLRLGCAGFLLKSLDRKALGEHLRRSIRSSPVIDHRIAGRLLAEAARSRTDGWWPGEHLGLSRRESEILTLLVEGLDTDAISHELFLGRETVRTHLRTLYGKLGVGSRAQAVARAYAEGLVRSRAPAATVPR